MEVKNGLILGIGISIVVLALALTFKSTLVTGHNDVNNARDMMNSNMMGNYDMDDMDKDGDGICDMCGMNIEDCEGMEEMCGSMMKMPDEDMEEMHKGCGNMMGNGNSGNRRMSMMMEGMYNE